MTPEVDVTVDWAKHGSTLVAFDIHDFPSADTFPPYNFEVLMSYHNYLSSGGTTH